MEEQKCYSGALEESDFDNRIRCSLAAENGFSITKKSWGTKIRAMHKSKEWYYVLSEVILSLYCLFIISNNSFGVTIKGFEGKCFIFPVTSMECSSCFAIQTS